MLNFGEKRSSNKCDCYLYLQMVTNEEDTTTSTILRFQKKILAVHHQQHCGHLYSPVSLSVLEGGCFCCIQLLATDSNNFSISCAQCTKS